jgi:hypothetical protein
MSNDGYFGLCPHCHKTNGYINVSRSHWFLCDEHKVKWCVGCNLFSSWREESEQEQEEAYYRLGIDRYTEVKPFVPPEIISAPETGSPSGPGHETGSPFDSGPIPF